MAKRALQVVIGYLVIALVVFAGLTLAWFAVGTEGAFKPKSFDPTPLWNGLAVTTSFLAALVGGAVTARMAGIEAPQRTRVLALVVLIVGVLFGVRGLGAERKPPPDPFPSEVSFADIGKYQREGYLTQAPWYLFTVPVVGFIGVMVGGRLGARPAEQAIA